MIPERQRVRGEVWIYDGPEEREDKLIRHLINTIQIAGRQMFSRRIADALWPRGFYAAPTVTWTNLTTLSTGFESQCPPTAMALRDGTNTMTVPIRRQVFGTADIKYLATFFDTDGAITATSLRLVNSRYLMQTSRRSDDAYPVSIALGAPVIGHYCALGSIFAGCLVSAGDRGVGIYRESEEYDPHVVDSPPAVVYDYRVQKTTAESAAIIDEAGGNMPTSDADTGWTIIWASVYPGLAANATSATYHSAMSIVDTSASPIAKTASNALTVAWKLTFS